MRGSAYRPGRFTHESVAFYPLLRSERPYAPIVEHGAVYQSYLDVPAGPARIEFIETLERQTLRQLTQAVQGAVGVVRWAGYG